MRAGKNRVSTVECEGKVGPMGMCFYSGGAYYSRRTRNR